MDRMLVSCACFDFEKQGEATGLTVLLPNSIAALPTCILPRVSRSALGRVVVMVLTTFDQCGRSYSLLGAGFQAE